MQSEWDYVVERMAQALAARLGEPFDKERHEDIVIELLETAGEDGWGFISPDEFEGFN